MSASQQDSSVGLLDEMHDGTLNGLATNPTQKSMSISVRDVRGNEYNITLENVISAVANNFRHGNIISSIQLTNDTGSLSHVDIADLAESDEPQHIKTYRTLFTDNASGRSFRVLKIIESIGCRALIVFGGHISISKTPYAA